MRKRFAAGQNSAFFQNQNKNQDVLIMGEQMDEVNSSANTDCGGSISQKGLGHALKRAKQSGVFIV